VTGGSVNLYEIQHVLNLFGITFDQTGRNAVIQLAGEMAGYNSVCEELRKQFENLDVDVNARIDKQELKRVVLNPEIDLRQFGWNLHQNYGQLSAIDMVFEEINVSGDEFISWDEFVSVCKQRL
jgi:Ca2+-binding EF-hand superfamily protein